MKCKIPEISWHNRDPVLSVDIQPSTNKVASVNCPYRLATGGTDTHVLIWYLNYTADGADINLDLAADLTRHQRAVNAVKWSPNGELLASGDDDCVVFIWKQKADHEPLNILDSTNEQDKEVWIVQKILRGHMEDIYDLSWAPNSQFLVSGSVDNSAIIWDVHKGKSTAILKDHKSFVQGVAWDPKNQYIATLSSDRYLRIFDINSKRVLHRINKSTLPVPESHELHGRHVRLFHDDTLQTFFRRLCFTPDGKLLLTPAGVAEDESTPCIAHTTYAFSRYAFRQPSLLMPSPDQYTVAVRCCPLLFRLRPHRVDLNPPVVPLPYRMIFAVATRSSVYFYDTQQRQPFAVISNIHYTRLTDITWSSDGRIVVVSSTDGFCSLITFEPGELGEEYEDASAVLNAVLTNDAVATRKNKKQKENDVHVAAKLRKLSAEKPKEEGEAKSAALQPLQENADKLQMRTLMNVGQVSTVNEGPNTATNITECKEENGATAKEDPTETELKKTKLTSKTVAPAVVILDKEILSSDEKFESPEKKCHAATPIMVRRTPRSGNNNVNGAAALTPNHTVSTASTAAATGYKSPLALQPSTNQLKRATPISVRRTPRALIPAVAAANASVVGEEALDAWPLGEESPQPAEVTQKPPEVALTPLVSLKSDNSVKDALECTEDIRLVYEETVEEGSNAIEAITSKIEQDTATEENGDARELEEKDTAATACQTKDTPTQQALTPHAKTPRRVELKTISTPKSKKKLLN